MTADMKMPLVITSQARVSIDTARAFTFRFISLHPDGLDSTPILRSRN